MVASSSTAETARPMMPKAVDWPAFSMKRLRYSLTASPTWGTRVSNIMA